MEVKVEVKMDITPPTTFTFLLFYLFTLPFYSSPLPWEGQGGYFNFQDYCPARSA